MSPIARITGRAWFAAGLAAIDFVAAIYLMTAPISTLRTSPTWVGALRLVPFGDPRILAVGFLIAAVLITVTVYEKHTRLSGVFGFALGSATWGLLMGSFIYGAFVSKGLGALIAGCAVFFAASHLGWLLVRR